MINACAMRFSTAFSVPARTAKVELGLSEYRRPFPHLSCEAEREMPHRWQLFSATCIDPSVKYDFDIAT